MRARRSTAGARLSLTAAVFALTVLSISLVPGSSGAKSSQKGSDVTVMTRNLYLGADLTPALQSTGADSFVDANGQIVRQVQATNFPVRAQALAQEILKSKPNLVGLQEVAHWQTSPPGTKSFAPAQGGAKTATINQYDFLQLLLDQLNKKGKVYRAVEVNDEFDFEAPADENPAPPSGINGASRNWRLTMRDVILARKGTKVSHPKGGHYSHLLVETVSGITIPVTRGWTSVDAKVGNGPKFHFVNTHLEAFDNSAVVPSVRAQQAAELTAPNGPTKSRLPVVLVCDCNSDIKTEVQPGDSQAYKVIRHAGFVERSTSKPLSCCISDPNLVGGSVSDFNHKVDHIMTNEPKVVKLVKSKVVGRSQFQGLWPSDHAGLVSTLKFK